jgi:hypothetical protein
MEESQAWWCMQEDSEYKARMGFMVRSCLKKQNKKRMEVAKCKRVQAPQKHPHLFYNFIRGNNSFTKDLAIS